MACKQNKQKREISTIPLSLICDFNFKKKILLTTMLINQNTEVAGDKVVLVPYDEHLVVK